MRQVMLCQPDGTPVEPCEIWEAHQGAGKLHQAFSACVFRHDGSELLIQKRHPSKLFGGLWANTCCSHPQPGEDIVAAGQRRLPEELGFSVPLTAGSSFVYQAEDPEGKGSEHEYDTILLGQLSEDVEITPDPAEVADWRWVKLTDLDAEMEQNPKQFAPWFHIIRDRYIEY